MCARELRFSTSIMEMLRVNVTTAPGCGIYDYAPTGIRINTQRLSANLSCLCGQSPEMFGAVGARYVNIQFIEFVAYHSKMGTTRITELLVSAMRGFRKGNDHKESSLYWAHIWVWFFCASVDGYAMKLVCAKYIDYIKLTNTTCQIRQICQMEVFTSKTSAKPNIKSYSQKMHSTSRYFNDVKSATWNTSNTSKSAPKTSKKANTTSTSNITNASKTSRASNTANTTKTSNTRSASL